MSLDPRLLSLRVRTVCVLADIEKAAKRGGKFDSVKHPRYPAGNPKGGQFRPKLGTGAGGAEIFMPVYTGSNKLIASFEAATLAVANQMAQGILTGAQKLMGMKTHPDDTNNLKLKSTVRQLAAGVAKPDVTPTVAVKPDTAAPATAVGAIPSIKTSDQVATLGDADKIGRFAVLGKADPALISFSADSVKPSNEKVFRKNLNVNQLHKDGMAALKASGASGAIKNYIDFDYKKVNEQLSTGALSQSTVNTVRSIEKAANSQELPAGLVMGRAFGADDAVVSQLLNSTGMVLQNLGATSTSINPAIGGPGGKEVRVKITAAAGATGVYIGANKDGDHAAFSGASSKEREVLLSPSSRFLVLSASQTNVDPGFLPNDDQTQVYLHLLLLPNEPGASIIPPSWKPDPAEPAFASYGLKLDAASKTYSSDFPMPDGGVLKVKIANDGDDFYGKPSWEMTSTILSPDGTTKKTDVPFALFSEAVDVHDSLGKLLSSHGLSANAAATGAKIDAAVTSTTTPKPADTAPVAPTAATSASKKPTPFFADNVQLWHGAGQSFKAFDPTKIGTGADAGTANWYGAGFYLSGEQWKAKSYADATGSQGQIASVKTSIENPLKINGTGASDKIDALKSIGIDPSLDGPALTSALQDKGYDGVVVYKNGSEKINEVVVFNADQVSIQDWQPAISKPVSSPATVSVAATPATVAPTAGALGDPPKIASASNPAYQKKIDGLYASVKAGDVAVLDAFIPLQQAKVDAAKLKPVMNAHDKWNAQLLTAAVELKAKATGTKIDAAVTAATATPKPVTTPVVAPVVATPVKPDTTGNWPATAQIKHVDNVVNGKGYKQEAALLNLNNFLLSATATPEGKQYAQAWIDHLKAGGTASPVATPKPTPAPVVTATATAPVISAPKGIGSKTHAQYTKQADAVYQSALAGDKAAVDAMVAQYQAKIDTAKLKPNYPTFADGQYNKLLAYSQKVQAEMQTMATAGLPATAPKSALTKNKLALADMTQVGGKPGGSNPGGVYQDADGAKWLVKGSNKPDPSGGPAQNEVLAARLYNAAGGHAPEMRTVDMGTQYGGGIGVASKMQDGLQPLDVNNPAHLAKAREDFALDAWMANRDVVGLSFDNTVIDQNGNALRIDPGGALLYRAQGEPKGADFSKTVGEWSSLRDASVNPQAAKVFAGMTDSELKASAAKVAAISDDTIQALVDRFGPGDAAAKAQLADTLIARKQDVIAKAGLIGATAAVAAATPVKPAAKTATTPPVKPDTSALTALQKAVFAIIDNAVTKAGAYSSLTDQDIQGVLGVLASSTASALSSSPQSKQYAQAWLDHLSVGGTATMTTAAATVKPAATSTAVPAIKPALPNFNSYKLEAGNSNASVVNAKVDKIAALAQAGDVAGLLALSYGSNTYAKKTVNLANDTLAALGSTATVTAGQKANSHPGIGTAGTAPVKPTTTPATPPATATHTGAWANQYGAGVGDLTTRVTALGATAAATAHFDPAKLDTPPDYANFHGPGQGLSSKAEKNAVSNQIAQELYVLAANGDLVALKNYDIAAQVGGVKGTVTESVVGAYRDMLISQIDNMLNPPKPVQTWKIGGPVTPDNIVQTLQQAFPKYQQYQQTFQNKAQMIGRWGIQGGLEANSLAKVVAAADAIPNKTLTPSSKELQKIYEASQAKYLALPDHERNAIQSYTGGIYTTWNTQIATNALSGPVKVGIRAYEKASVELPPGLVLSRKWDIPDHLAGQIQPGLLQSEGKVVQDLAMISSSIDPSVWHGEVQMRIKTLPGARGLYVGNTANGKKAISTSPSEKEIVFNSKTRFLVTKVSQKNYDSSFFGGKKNAIFMDVLALPEDPAGSVLDSLGGSS